VRTGTRAARHILFWTIVLAVILVPFFLFGEKIDKWTEQTMKGDLARHTAGLLMGGLLASDILLPVPSSLASTACGYLLGILPGTLVSFAGMSISSLAGYWLGRKPGSKAFSRSLGPNEMKKLEQLSERFGEWIIVLARPVPVLAEASVFFAGLSHMKFRTFLLMVSLSNLGISALYATVGAKAAAMNTFLIAFGASMLLPLLFMGGAALLTAKQRAKTKED